MVIDRSQSLWSINSKRYSISGSTTSSGARRSISGSSAGLSRKFRRRSELDLVQPTRFTCVPCLNGDINAMDEQGRTLLFYAARYGQLDSVMQLVQAGCDANQTDKLGNTPLHEAIERGNIEVAKILLKEGKADVNASGRDGETPLMIALSRGLLDTVRLLHKAGADLNKCDAFGNPPITKALQRGWSDITDFLLDHQCDLNRVSANGMSTFHAAAHCNKIDLNVIARRLLKADYDFRKDAEWLADDSCPVNTRTESRVHDKVLEHAGLKQSTHKKSSFLKSGRRKIVKTFRSLSGSGSNSS